MSEGSNIGPSSVLPESNQSSILPNLFDDDLSQDPSISFRHGRDSNKRALPLDPEGLQVKPLRLSPPPTRQSVTGTRASSKIQAQPWFGFRCCLLLIEGEKCSCSHELISEKPIRYLILRFLTIITRYNIKKNISLLAMLLPVSK